MPTILLVEDDPFIRDALAEMLHAEGYAVHRAEHGGYGLAALAEYGPFGLILLDLVMPEVSGLAFRRGQLASPAWRQIPTVVLTADVCAASRQRELRQALLVEKPLNVAQLLELVRDNFRVVPSLC